MILDRYRAKHFPATRPIGADCRAADQRPSIRSWLAGIIAAWRADLRRVFVEDCSGHDVLCRCEACRSPRFLGDDDES